MAQSVSPYTAMNMGQSSALIARQHRPEVRTQCRMLHPVGYCCLQISQLAAAVMGPGGNMPGLHALTLHQLRDGVGQLYLATCSGDRKSTRLNSSHVRISYAVFCLKKKNNSDDITSWWPP